MLRGLYTTLFLIMTLTVTAEQLLFAPKSMDDWTGAVRKTTCVNGVFDTGRDQFVLISKQVFPISPEKRYRLSGVFQLKPYAPFGNIYFGLVCVNAEGKEIRRLYIGESPLNSRVAPGNKDQVRVFPLTFQGSVPSAKFSFPDGTVAVKVILHQFEDYIVDMTFSNIRLIEE